MKRSAVECAALILGRIDRRAGARTGRRARTRRGRWRRRRRGCSPRRRAPISTPASGGPAKIVSRFAAWKNAVAVADVTVLLADELGHDRALHGRGRARGTRRSPRRARAARGTAARRPSGGAGSRRRAARARCRTISIVRRVPSRAAIAPPQKPDTAIGTISAIRTQRHPLRRAGRAQHEPGDRDPRHLRAGRRDHLGRRAARRGGGL